MSAIYRPVWLEGICAELMRKARDIALSPRYTRKWIDQDWKYENRRGIHVAYIQPIFVWGDWFEAVRHSFIETIPKLVL